MKIIFAALALLLVAEAARIQPAQGIEPKLPNFALSPALAQALSFAQISISSTILKEAKLTQGPGQTPLGNINIPIDDDLSLQLSNLKLNVPSMEVTSANPNLELLNMALDVYFGTLEVAGSFKIVSKKLKTELPATSSGEFTLTNSNFKGTGKVGLSFQTNFFSTVNYDVAYQASGSRFTVSYLNNDKLIVKELEPKSQETKIVAHINRQLKSVLNRMVKERLNDILVAIQVDNLIGENQLVESYKEHTRALRALANDYVDQLLLLVEKYVVENGLANIEAPELHEAFEHEILFIPFWGSFDAVGGLVRNLATLERTGDCNLDLDPETGAIIVSGHLGLAVLHLHYDTYRAEFEGISVSGSLTGDVGENSLFLKISILIGAEIKIELLEFHIEEAKDIRISITGLGILDWLVDFVADVVIALFEGSILGLVETQLRAYIEEMLPNLTLP